MKPLIKLEAKVPVNIFYGENAFVAHCPVFDVSSQGDTEEEGKENIIEAITEFLLACYEMGTLSEVLRECGFIPVSKVEQEYTEKDSDYIDIPLPFILKNWDTDECHV